MTRSGGFSDIDEALPTTRRRVWFCERFMDGTSALSLPIPVMFEIGPMLVQGPSMVEWSTPVKIVGVVRLLLTLLLLLMWMLTRS
jgi:hypothetical protein